MDRLSLCKPARICLVVSMIAWTIILIQNLGSRGIYCAGPYSCNTNSIALIFTIKFIFIIICTVILNQICRAGYNNISWALLPLLIVMFFGIVVSVISIQQKLENAGTSKSLATNGNS